MKILSIAVPCYNSQAYMRKCIDSLLEGGEDVEILVVDDGSSDETAQIADEYAEKYPTIVKAIHQENGGHGEAVNTGIRNASGIYFKVVDSDDWVQKEAYLEILSTLSMFVKGSYTVDMLISNFVYEKQGARRKKIMQYKNCFPEKEVFTWDKVGRLPKGKYLLMHSLIYRTKLLHDCQLLSTLSMFVKGSYTVDMLISNFVYEKQGARRKKIMQYKNCFPEKEVFTWDKVGRLPKGKYLLMHSLIYRTKLLHDCQLKLPKHTFYVDNLFAFEPLPYVKNMYYLNVNFYRYFIGREDQSVNEEVMIRRIDQQLLVNKRMIDTYVKYDLRQKGLRKYMRTYLDIIMTVSSIMLLRSGTEEAIEKKNELWAYLKNADRYLYRKIRYGLLGRAVNLPGSGGRKISVDIYRVVQKFYGFN